MNTLKNKILLVCSKCKRVVLVNRSKWDLQDAIFLKSDCDKCDGDTQMTPEYYNEDGIMDYGKIEEQIAKLNREDKKA